MNEDPKPTEPVFVRGNDHLDRLLSDPLIASSVAAAHADAGEMDPADVDEDNAHQAEADSPAWDGPGFIGAFASGRSDVSERGDELLFTEDPAGSPRPGKMEYPEGGSHVRRI